MAHSDMDSDHFDLLPFISILMCVLGCLLLVTISMASISMGLDAGEAWLPTKRESSKGVGDRIPLLVEWDGEEVTFHFGKSKITAAYSADEFQNVTIAGGTYLLKKKERNPLNKAFYDAIDRMQAIKDTHYALIAVRPSGFKSLSEITMQFRDKNILIGYEPLAQTKKVSLRLPN